MSFSKYLEYQKTFTKTHQSILTGKWWIKWHWSFGQHIVTVYSGKTVKDLRTIVDFKFFAPEKKEDCNKVQLKEWNFYEQLTERIANSQPVKLG